MTNLRRLVETYLDKSHLYLILALLLLIFCPRLVLAQGDPLNQAGAPTFAATQPVELGFIDVSNGNLHQTVALGSFPQRGRLSLSAGYVYDSRIWQVVCTTSCSWQPTNVPSSQGGWRYISSASPGVVRTLQAMRVTFVGDTPYRFTCSSSGPVLTGL